MDLKYLYPYWGSEHLSANEIFDLVIANDFDGIEINIPKDDDFETQFYDVLGAKRREQPGFRCVLQQVIGTHNETPATHLEKVLQRLNDLAHYQPDVINSHTGRDYFTFDENCRIIEAIENFSIQKQIPILHEIHRGRFTFHSRTTLEYLEEFPQLKLVGDLSHWCVVSESLLQNQEDIISEVIPHIYHIHARVGFEQTPQVNNPFAPEWKPYLDQFTQWWRMILDYHRNALEFTITPEFGPYPYMPQEPFTKTPLANQNELNLMIKTYLKSELA